MKHIFFIFMLFLQAFLIGMDPNLSEVNNQEYKQPKSLVGLTKKVVIEGLYQTLDQGKEQEKNEIIESFKNQAYLLKMIALPLSYKAIFTNAKLCKQQKLQIIDNILVRTDISDEERNSLIILKEIISHNFGDTFTIETKGNPEKTLAHHAIQRNSVYLTHQLLQFGAPVNVVEGCCLQSLLHLAIQHNTDDNATTIINLLMHYGAQINTQDRQQSTPLHKAIAKGYPKSVQALLAYKPDIILRDIYGQTPLSLAQSLSGKPNTSTIKAMIMGYKQKNQPLVAKGVPTPFMRAGYKPAKRA